MLIILLIAFAKSIVVGLDFGHENIKIGLALLGRGVHVALNQQNKRLSPSYFAIWNTSNPNQTTRTKHLSIAEIRGCTWAYNEEAYRYYLKFPQTTFRGLENISCDYNGLMRREAYAILLHHLFKTMDDKKHEPVSTHVVFAIDPDMPCKERYMIHEVIKISGANLKSIVDAPSSAANLYALEKSKLYGKSPKTIAFVDIGAKKAWMSIFSFRSTPGNPIVKQLSIISNISIGGDFIDSKLAHFFINKFSQNYNINSIIPERVELLFIDEARKVKERLSLHTSVDVKFDVPYFDKIFEYTITRDQFENLISEFNETLSQAYLKLIENANIIQSEIDSIEIIGGSTRIPFIQNILLEASGVGRLNRTMNSDEAIALGAGYIGAANSADFLATKKVKISTFCNMDVFLRHNEQIIQLFNKTDRIDDTNSYEFKSYQNAYISILTGSKEINMEEIVKFIVKIPPETNENATIHVDFGFDEFLLPGIFNIMIDQQSSREIEFINPIWSMTKLDFNRSISFIKKMDDVSEERRETQVAFSDFESYLYTSKNKILNTEVIQKVTTEDERQKLIEEIDKNINWLLNDTHKMSLTSRIIRSRMETLKKKIDDVELKASELPKREPAFKRLMEKIKQCQKALNETWVIERPWMPEKARNTMQSAIDHAINYYHIYRDQQGNRTEKEIPGVLAHDIDMQTYYLEMTYNFTLRTTKNPPTPKPPKTPNPYVKTYSSIDEYERDAEKQRERDLFGL